LAVEDLERALRFYRDGLGFESRGVIGTQWTDEESGANGAIAVFKFESGLLLSLYPHSDLAKDAAIPAGPARPGEFSLGQLVQSRAEVTSVRNWRPTKSIICAGHASVCSSPRSRATDMSLTP
jgi:catechol 2,3-dioxygenase-like lactoylglutathione lyase family enzyme